MRRPLEVPQRIVGRERRFLLTFRRQRFRTAQQAFAKRETIRFSRRRQGRLQLLHRIGRADRSHRAGRRLGNLGVRVLEESRERRQRLFVVPHAHAADHADQESSLQLAEGVAQGGIDRGPGNRFQSVARHVRQLLVAQQRGQRGHGVGGPDPAEFATSVRLGGELRVRFEDLDPLCFLFLARCLGQRGMQASAKQGRHQQHECWYP